MISLFTMSKKSNSVLKAQSKLLTVHSSVLFRLNATHAWLLQQVCDGLVALKGLRWLFPSSTQPSMT